MKNYYYFIGIVVLSITSCKKDFIELTPEDSYSSAAFYQNEAQFRTAINAAYTPLRDVATYDFYLSEMRSDNTHYQPIPSDRGNQLVERENIADFTNTSSNSFTNNLYFSSYTGIMRCNVIIERLQKVDIGEAAETEIDGQAKFLRALNYFKLVKLYGGVPLYLKEVVQSADAYVNRSTIEQVYEQIIKDATDANNELAVVKLPQTGRATKGAATMLLADVYATQKKYAEAEPLLKSLATMGYGLNANYADAFATTNKNSKESIFEVQYLSGTTSGSAPSNFIYQFLPRTIDATVITGVKTNNTAIGGWNTPTPEILAAYDANDTIRLNASIGIAEGTYNASDQFTISANKSIVNYTPAAGKIGIPYIKKYLHPHTDPNNTNDNWPVYRYSDALLLLAETLNEQGKSADALIPLNTVRARAGLTPVTETGQNALRDIILHERRIELAFENRRWNDLVRSGTAVAVMNAYGTKMKQMYPYLSSGSYNVTADKLIYPIPQSEIEINPDLTQNPGY